MALKRNKIENFLKNSVVIRLYEQIDSTNDEAKRRAQADQENTVLYVTDCQTAGRGRRGHDFYSPKGSGLYFTLALPLSAEPADIQVITCAAAVAVCEAIGALSDQRPLIKWVNDIYIDGKKVAGILTELVTDADNRPLSVIVGIGLNLTTEHFPAEFAARAGAIGDIDPNRLCAEITDRLTDMYRQLENAYSAVGGGAPDVPKMTASAVGTGLDTSVYGATVSKRPSESYNSIMEKYKCLNFCIGKTVKYTDTDGNHTAAATDIAPDGSLIVEENGVRKSLHSGEISIGSLA